MKRRPMSKHTSRKVFRRTSKLHRKNAMNSTAGGIMRGGIRF